LKFYEARKHAVIPSASLVPENDPTTLFTGSGMQPLVPYLLGESHPEGRRLVNSEKCFRAEDIDEVGDNRHTTFFEMLGNWSLGDYFKEEQLPWLFEFLTDKDNGAGLNPERLYVTVFAGDAATGIPADDESVAIWKKLFAEKKIDAHYVALGSEEQGSNHGMQGGRIFSYDVKKNWWSRAGVPAKMPAGEPGGPDSEVFYDFDPSGTVHDPKFGKECHPNCDCGRFLEIGNSVFMEYKKRADGTFEKLQQRNVDFGGGLERITAAANGDPDVFTIDTFKNVLGVITNGAPWGTLDSVIKRDARIASDHIRASVFLVADGVLPGNKGRNYIVRRLLRRSLFYLARLDYAPEFVEKLVRAIITAYGGYYKELVGQHDAIVANIQVEITKFATTLKHGRKELEKILSEGKISGKNAFDLYQTFGYPWELTHELATQKGFAVDRNEFESEFKKHQDLSRTSSAGTFKGGLADTSEKTVKLHTTHHLLLKALQTVLGPQVKQRGSNITSERLRLDFSYDGKMTGEQKKEVERIVNEKIAEDLPVVRSEMAREDAEKLGAEHEFGQKYPDRVSVYSVGPKGATIESPQFEKAFSIEFCGGPHVAHTGEIGHFTLAKEEAVAAGIRRVRGVLE